MEYIITIDNFSGPLDLLLHLLKKDNVKIEDINIEKITEQYLNYINKMETLDLDVTSEYLVMAAELIEMKSYVLLPVQVNNEEEENPREELIKRLIEYRNYKEITDELKLLEDERKKYFSKDISDLSPFEIESHDKTECVDVLIEAFNNFIKRQELDKPIDTKVAIKEYSLTERNKEIGSIIRKRKKVEFKELFDKFDRGYIIITFLSILDLSKKQEIKIIQENNFKDIFLVNKGDYNG
ncbi:MAG: segregation/condensation protein A [Bacilli bacterium]|nr:segregation/condensation protein A [Bacilli bacterium]